MVANTALAWSVDYWPDDWVRPVIDLHKSLGVTALGFVALRVLWRAAHAPPAAAGGLRPARAPGRAGRAWRALSRDDRAAAFRLAARFGLEGLAHASAAALRPGPLAAHRLVIADLPPETKEHWHDLFGAAHHFIGYAFYALFAAHVLAALKHQFFDNEPELQRMWPASGARR